MSLPRSLSSSWDKFVLGCSWSTLYIWVKIRRGSAWPEEKAYALSVNAITASGMKLKCNQLRA